ncbi:Plasmodium exported protein (hyp10), unknown, putative [Plasmodium sp.]|nr:Plasmodium exported protein (hyp10), unknown, putative [Plasmodium sp.]
MSCNYFKLSLFSIFLCIFIITHKFFLEQITPNKINTVDIINAGHKRSLAESQETDVFKTHSGENLRTQPIDNKLEEIVTEYRKTSSSSMLNDEFLKNFYDQTKQIKWKNENNNNSFLHKLHMKKHHENMKIIFIIVSSMMLFPLFPLFYIQYYNHKENKQK